MNRGPVLTKDDMYRRWTAGEFGNKPRSWMSFAELAASGFDGSVTIRYREASSPYVRYSVPVGEVPLRLDEFCQRGANRELFTFNESMPDEYVSLQGEFLQNTQVSGPWYLHYSTQPGKMRDVLIGSGQHAYGLETKIILLRYMDTDSYEWLQELADLYPEHVVEFSTYSQKVGDLRQNTVFWEVRNY